MSDTTHVKPCSRIQMISSWRRTRRWLAPYPPGRSQTANLSLTTHEKFRGWMPWAHLPFIPGTALLPGQRCSPGDDLGGVHGGPHIMHPNHADALDHGPHGRGHRALEAVVDRHRIGGARTVGIRQQSAEEALPARAD